MDFSMLPILKDKLVREKQLKDVWNFFLDHFGENRQFMEKSASVKCPPDLQDTLFKIAAMMSNAKLAMRVDLATLGFPKKNFYHGSALLATGQLSFIYFDDIRVGSTCYITGFSGESKFTRFVFEKLADGSLKAAFN